MLKASRLVEQAAVLRDTKHFVKDYQGNSLAPGSLIASNIFAKILNWDPQAGLRQLALWI